MGSRESIASELATCVILDTVVHCNSDMRSPATRECDKYFERKGERAHRSFSHTTSHELHMVVDGLHAGHACRVFAGYREFLC